MSKHVEIWTQPETGSFIKKIADLPWARVGFNRGVSIVGQGSLTLPAAYDRLDELIDPENDTGSLVRVWESGLNVNSFYADDVAFSEDKQGTVTITGPNIENGLEKGIVYPWDWTDGATKTFYPDWVYGVGSSIISDISFDDDVTSPLVNGDFEKGDASGWSEFGSDEDHPVELTVINNPSNAYEGNYFVILDPGKVHSGVKQTDIKVYPGKTNTFSARVKEPGALGTRITMGYRADEGTVGATGSPYFQTFYDGSILAELDNATSGNGASDGTWQEIVMQATWGPSVESTDLFIQHDEHGDDDGPLYWVDKVTMEGFGVGAGAWEAIGTEWMTSFGGSTFVSRTGANSLTFTVDGISQPLGAVGIKQPLDFENGAPYVAEVWVYTPTAGTPTVRLSVLQGDGGQVMSTITADLVQDTWTKLEIEFTPFAGILEGFMVLAWDETTAGTLYVDDFDIKDGLPPANAGKIVGDALDAITTRDGGSSALLWLKRDGWDDTNDSNGQPWGEKLYVRISRGMTLRQLLDRLKDWGIEWEVVWNVGSSQYELKLFKKFDGTTGGAGGASSIRLISGKSFRTGQVRLRDAGPNTWLAEGAAGTLMEKQSSALEAGYGRIEGYISQGNAEGSTTLESIIDTSLVESENQKFGIKASLFQRPFPVLDFDLGDRLGVNLPPHLPDDTYRTIGYTAAWDAKADSDEYTLSFSTHVFDDPFGGTTSEATSAGLNYLLGKFEGLVDVGRFGASKGTAAPPIERAPTVTVASVSARQYVKNHADVVCTGVNDHLKIQEAVRLLPDGAGRIVLSEGPFWCSITTGNTIFTLPDNTALEGIGNATILVLTGDNSGVTQYGIDMGADCTVANMYIDLGYNDDDDFIGIRMTAEGALIDNVTANEDAKGSSVILAEIDYGGVLHNCHSDTPEWGVRLINGIVQGCYFGDVRGVWCPEFSDGVLITGNYFEGRSAVYLDQGKRAVIVGNYFPDDSDFANQTIRINNWDGAVIGPNYFANQAMGS